MGRLSLSRVHMAEGKEGRMEEGWKGDSRGPHDSFRKQREARITGLSVRAAEIAMSAATQPRSKAERNPPASERTGGREGRREPVSRAALVLRSVVRRVQHAIRAERESGELKVGVGLQRSTS